MCTDTGDSSKKITQAGCLVTSFFSSSSFRYRGGSIIRPHVVSCKSCLWYYCAVAFDKPHLTFCLITINFLPPSSQKKLAWHIIYHQTIQGTICHQTIQRTVCHQTIQRTVCHQTIQWIICHQTKTMCQCKSWLTCRRAKLFMWNPPCQRTISYGQCSISSSVTHSAWGSLPSATP